MPVNVLLPFARTGAYPGTSVTDFSGHWGHYEAPQGDSDGPRGPAFRENSLIWAEPVSWLLDDWGTDARNEQSEWSQANNVSLNDGLDDQTWDMDQAETAATPWVLSSAQDGRLQIALAPNWPVTGDTTTFTATAATADTTIGNTSGPKYFWFFDTEPGSVDVFGTGSLSPQTTHTFTAAGTHKVTVVAVSVPNADGYVPGDDCAFVVSASREIVVLSNLQLAITSPAPTAATGGTWSVSGTVQDGGGNPVAGAAVAVSLDAYGYTWGTAQSQANGTFTVGPMAAPGNAGVYELTVTAAHDALTAGATQSLTVTSPVQGHDLAVQGSRFEISASNIPLNGMVSISAKVDNVGQHDEQDVTLFFELLNPSGTVVASRSVNVSPAVLSIGGLSDEAHSGDLQADGTAGVWTARARVELSYGLGRVQQQLRPARGGGRCAGIRLLPVRRRYAPGPVRAPR